MFYPIWLMFEIAWHVRDILQDMQERRAIAVLPVARCCEDVDVELVQDVAPFALPALVTVTVPVKHYPTETKRR
jgi:hypothetical protein